MDLLSKEKYDINDLVEIVKILRSPDGCPWDKVQTHETIRKDFIEEVYEAVEAIDEKDTEHLREELGDVLLQVVFHSVLESEQHHFTFDDVTDEISRKMIIRHPHVFGDINAETTEEVLKNWDEIKMQTHSQKTVSEAMDSVSKTLPSLMRAEKLQKKAKRGGVYLQSADEVFDDINNKLEALKSVISVGDSELQQEKVGELLFSIVKLSGITNTDCEQSLYNACEKFTEQFKVYENAAVQKGVNIQDSDTDVTNQLWKEISKKEKLEEI